MAKRQRPRHRNCLSRGVLMPLLRQIWANFVRLHAQTFLLLIIAAAGLNSPAEAEFWDVDNLNIHRAGYLALERGEVNWNNLVEDSYFTGYIVGVADTILGIVCCPPPDITLHEIVSIVSKYMDEHEAKRFDSAESIVRAALERAFPCP